MYLKTFIKHTLGGPGRLFLVFQRISGPPHPQQKPSKPNGRLEEHPEALVPKELKPQTRCSLWIGGLRVGGLLLALVFLFGGFGSYLRPFDQYV